MSETELEHIEYEWRAFPAREQPSRAVLGGLAVVALATGAAVLGQSVIWAGLAVLFLLVVLNRFFMPSRFVVTAEGILAQYPLSRRFLRWADIRRFAGDEHGGFLSTRARSSMLDSLQGVHLLFGAVHEEAMRAIRRHLDPQLLSACGDQTAEDAS